MRLVNVLNFSGCLNHLDFKVLYSVLYLFNLLVVYLMKVGKLDRLTYDGL